MSHDMLAIIWFGLWGVIWTVYFILDGYALGNGMIFPFVTKDRQERNQLQEAIGPFWGGNEVWLITAGGAHLLPSQSHMLICLVIYIHRYS